MELHSDDPLVLTAGSTVKPMAAAATTVAATTADADSAVARIRWQR